MYIKHKTTKFDVVEVRPAAHISWSFPNRMARTIWFSNQDFQLIIRTAGCVFSEKVIAFLTIWKTFL